MTPRQLRDQFEAWISAPPYERSLSRHTNDAARTAWPGQYRNYEVELAWNAWQAAHTVQSTQAQTYYCISCGKAKDKCDRC